MSRCVRAIINVALFTSFHSVNVLFVIPAVGKLQVAVVFAFQQLQGLDLMTEAGAGENGGKHKAAREDG
jgi:hypothetical protein